ncbi:LOW QUALITY PROTEIN: postacrosomal sheath WW domain-binding protein [Mustela lutreola]|uniref:LOW QUALITY PROTEIN: postacrosomal sheath WW domain-binding protein n=1 Tax=Mustela putorius furo TaxID=9669 RepID=A0A8U0SBL0_MUSPF|nr:LOW QUALITY PROTEIN: postacrosomal sheath WW domain-binding protein [Mustela putorius furo]XP_059043525.1 LOW QUALITY PROTEIN: postacrosomal sheath WW domain-binding protein [Mustela lutreola]
MAVNQSHTENRRGAIIPFGESVLTQCQDVELSFPHQPEGSSVFCGTKRGTVFLTSYRVIFVTSHTVNDSMCSFMMPFDLMSNCTVEQPVFTPNFIKGIIQAAPDGGWEGQATFKLAFRKGGAIEFAQMMMKAASAAARGVPLGSLNYWFSSPGLYVVTGRGACAPNRCLVQDTGPYQEYSEHPLQDTDPYQLEMKLHWPEMKTHPRQMKPRLRHTEFHLLELELGLADLWQRSLLGMSLLFPLLHLLSPIYNLLGNNH